MKGSLYAAVKSRQNAAAAAWLLPAFVFIGYVVLIPVLQVIRYSFTDKTPFTGGEWVGLDNYQRLLTGPDSFMFWRAFRNNLVLLVSIPATVIVGLVIAGILYRGITGSRVYETLIFLPFLPAVAAISVIFIYILGFNGPLNSSLQSLGLDIFSRPWLTDPNIAIWSVLAVVTWKRIGFVVLLFMGRLLSIEKQVLEAAAVDGASWWETFRYVIIPEMKSIIQFVCILGFIEVFSFTFAYIFVLTRGGPFKNTYTLEYLLFATQFRRRLTGLSAAIAVFLLLMAAGVGIYRVVSARKEGDL